MRMPTTKKLSAAVDYTKTYTLAINCVKLIITFYRSPLYIIDRNIFFYKINVSTFFLPHVELTSRSGSKFLKIYLQNWHRTLTIINKNALCVFFVKSQIFFFNSK